MIKAIIFDLDGVLISMVEGHYKALNQALKEIAKYEIPEDDQIKYYNGISTDSKLKILQNRGIITPNDCSKIWNRKQNLTIEYINQFKKDIEKINMCKCLVNDKYILSCVSNSIIKSTYKMLKQIGVLDYLEFFLGNECFGEKIKPNPYPYLMAFDILSLDPKECLIIEDSPKGIASAEKSGGWVLKVKDPTEVIYKNITNKITEVNNS